MEQTIYVIGGGLAGSEAAWQIAQRGIRVKLFEMRPAQMTPAHHSAFFAELVCSNSLRASNLTNAVGLLKEEMRQLYSLIMSCADQTRLPAGGALAVDREAFSRMVTEKITRHPLIEVRREEVKSINPNELTVVATGPLTSNGLARELSQLTGAGYLYFYDAAAPIVYGESIDYERAFWASRYNKGTADYLNCPMNEAEYQRFYEALITAEVHPLKEFEEEKYFEGCMPIEVMAKRGSQTLLFGPLKPVGLYDERKQERPYAVVQLRQDNRERTLLNMVGFQTRLKWGEQQRVFRLIPGLEKAEFARFGVMHRNTFLNSPQVLLATTQLKAHPRILIAGQLSGVEGYVESAASGLIAGINAGRLFKGQEPLPVPPETAIGALLNYISDSSLTDFQPMNITFGLMPPWPEKVRDKEKKHLLIAERALKALAAWKAQL